MKKIWTKVSGLSENILKKEAEEIKPQIKLKQEISQPASLPKKEEWLDELKGQLSVDLYEEGDNFILISVIAGIQPEDLEISAEKDLIIIKGKRPQINQNKKYHLKECFWGKFSRTIILPEEIRPEKIKATLKNGLLTVIMPKMEENKKLRVGHE